MGDEHHRHPLGGEILDHVEHLPDQFRIECARHLVEQHHRRVHRERTGDGDALLLPAGERLRVGGRLVAQSDTFQQLAGAVLGGVCREPADLLGGERDVAQRGLVWEQVERLEHHPDLLADLVHVRLDHRLAVEVYVTRLDLLQPVGTPEQGGLPRARRADDDHHLAFLDCEVDPVKHLRLPEELVDAVELHQGVAHDSSPPPEPRVSRPNIVLSEPQSDRRSNPLTS